MARREVGAAAGLALLALLALTLAACTTYERPPALEPRADPVAPIQIFVVVGASRAVPHATPQSGGWRAAADFARTLQLAGFEPVVVPQRSDVPAGVPFTERYAAAQHDPRAECRPWHEQRAFTLLTGGVIPTFDCQQYGHRLELHRSLEAPAELIGTRWKVNYVYGWLAVPLGLAAGYSISPLGIPGSSGVDREPAALRAALLDALAEPR